MTDTTSVSIFDAPNAVAVLTDAAKFDRFYEDVKRETDTLTIDLTTERGRRAIASMAYKVARTKTALDEAGKTLTAELRAQVGVVDEARRNIRDKLDALKEEVRKPLTDWEIAEDARVARVNAALERWRTFRIAPDDTPETVAAHLAYLRTVVITYDEFGIQYDVATNLKEAAEGMLEAAHVRLIKEAEDRAELERLRAAEAGRVEAERVKAEEVARIEREAEQARRDEEDRQAAEAKRKAEEDAIAQRAADAARAEAERQHAEALAAEKRRADEAEAARAAEAKRIADERAAAEAEAERQRSEQEARDRDRKHRTTVMTAAKVAIMAQGADEETAKKIVLAIIAGEVPNVNLRF